MERRGRACILFVSSEKRSLLEMTPDGGPLYAVDCSGTGMEPVRAQFSGADAEAEAIKFADMMRRNSLTTSITISRTSASQVLSIRIKRNKDGEWRSAD
jgi:hypothetical protein